MVKKIIVLFLGAMLTLGLGSMANAQEEVEVELALGVVSEVSSSSITIIDSDYEEETEAIFAIDENTVFENIESAEEIEVGSEVYIDYVIEADRNVAVSIFKAGVNAEEYEIEDDEDVDMPKEDMENLTIGEETDDEPEEEN